MKTNTIKNIFILSIFFLFAGLASLANASANYIDVSPKVSTIDQASNTSISVSVATSGDKICVAKGTIVLDNLTCENITLASGIISAVTPTCSSPKFLVGIPKCTTVNSDLFIVSTKAGNVGQASISFTDVNLFGTATSISTESAKGDYKIVAVSTPNIEPVKTENEKPVLTPVVNNPTAPENQVQPVVDNQNQTPAEQQNVAPQTAGLIESTGAKAVLGWISKNILPIAGVLVLVILYFVVKSYLKKKKGNNPLA